MDFVSYLFFLIALILGTVSSVEGLLGLSSEIFLQSGKLQLFFHNSRAAFGTVIYRLNFFINRMFDRKWAGNIEIIRAFDLDE